MFEHAIPAKTFVNGYVAIIGDAAHATTPGNGAGFAIEDAYVLSSLLAHVQQPDQIPACLKAFDAVRKERGHDLVKTSKHAGMLWNMRAPNIGDDLEKIKENIMTRFEWIWAVDHEADIQRGLKLMGM